MKRHTNTAARIVAVCLTMAATMPVSADTGDGKEAPGGRPVVGAIRWDGWNAWGYYEKCFDPPEWRHRLPFYASITPDDKARVRGDTQQVIDKEIAFAKAAGLDYWAFVYYHPAGWPPHSADMVRSFELYLASEHRDDINYALIISGGLHLGPKDQLQETMDYFARRFKDPNYQKVMDGRPLAYFLGIPDIADTIGSESAAREWLEGLRKKSIALGAGNPYFVVMEYWPPRCAEQMEAFGCDAVGTYTGHCIGQVVADKEFPYSALAEANRKLWDIGKATGKAFIPTLNAGWDFRPMKRPEYPDRDPEDDWYLQPTPAELAENLRDALAWVEANPSACPANAVLIYAWNELSEGGWLVPTLSEGTARLDAIREVLLPEAGSP